MCLMARVRRGAADEPIVAPGISGYDAQFGRRPYDPAAAALLDRFFG
jgi:hypothetical protein